MKKIGLLACGGSIACVSTPAGLDPRMTAGQILSHAIIPPRCRVEGVDLMRRTTLAPDDWVKLAKAIVVGKDWSGIVATVGTDTLAYAACAMSLMLVDIDRPIVLTGAMLPLGADGSSAARNVSDALTIARRSAAGVFVVFDGRVINAASASKVHASRSDDTFQSVNAPQAGTVSDGRARWATPPPHSPLRGHMMVDTRIGRRVMTVKVTPQLTAAEVEAWPDYAGYLIEGYGDGNVPTDLIPPLRRLAQDRVVVIASQCPFGEVFHRYEGGLALISAGALSAGSMTCEMALVRLMWALRTGSRDAALKAFAGTEAT